MSPGESSDEEGEHVSTVQVEIHRQTSTGTTESQPVTVEEIKIIREGNEDLDSDIQINGSGTHTINMGQKEGVMDETWSLQSRKVSIERGGGAGTLGSPPTVAKNP